MFNNKEQENLLNSIMQLQNEIKRLNDLAKPLKERLKKSMQETSQRTVTNQFGHKATLVESYRWNANREKAQEILDAKNFLEIFKSSKTLSLRLQ